MCNAFIVRSVTVEEMARSLGFYSRLGLEILDGAEGQEHMMVEIGTEVC